MVGLADLSRPLCCAICAMVESRDLPAVGDQTVLEAPKADAPAKPAWYTARLQRRREQRAAAAQSAGRCVRSYTKRAHVETQGHITKEADRVIESTAALVVKEMKKITGSSCSTSGEVRANIALMQKTLQEKIIEEKTAKGGSKKPSTSKRPKLTPEEKSIKDAEKKAKAEEKKQADELKQAKKAKLMEAKAWLAEAKTAACAAAAELKEPKAGAQNAGAVKKVDGATTKLGGALASLFAPSQNA